MTELAELLVQDAEAWHAWLDSHHAEHPGVWLVLHKKGGHTTALTYAQALDEALCFGWIDGHRAGAPRSRRRSVLAAMSLRTQRRDHSEPASPRGQPGNSEVLCALRPLAILTPPDGVVSEVAQWRIESWIRTEYVLRGRRIICSSTGPPLVAPA